MAPKKKKNKNPGKNLCDESAEILLNCEYSIPITKRILKDKPHLISSKYEDVPASMDELKLLCATLTDEVLQEDKEKGDKEKSAQALGALSNFVKLVLQIEDFINLPQIKRIVHHISIYLNHDYIPAKVKTNISFLCERFIEVSLIDEHLEESHYLLNYLLDLTLSAEHAKKIDIKRVWSLKVFIDHIDLEIDAWKNIARKYLLTVTNSNYLGSREGQHVIGYLLKKRIFTKKIHDMILQHIPTLPKHLAGGYGQSYFVAWTYADEDGRKIIEHFIYLIVEKVLKIPRAGVDMPKAGANCLALLSTLHSCRKMRNFSQTLNDLYSPIIWRFLRDHDPWIRCNAAQIFFDVFPLEDPSASAAENSDYLDKQTNEMKDLLLDDSHFVRIIAIRGICSNLAQSLELFTVAQVKHILEILALELTHDGSSYLVRKAVFEGFETMLSEPLGSNDPAPPSVSGVLQRVLPSVRQSFYDSNEKVRKAFVKMLLKLKEKAPFVEQRYWNIVSLEDIIIKFATEGPVVGELLSNLCIDQMIHNQSTDVIINRLCKMLDWSFEGVKNAFKYSHKALTVHDAHRAIVTIIGSIRKSLKDHLDSLKDDSISSEPKPAEVNTTKKNKAQALGPPNSIPEEEDIHEDDLESSINNLENECPNTTASSVATSTTSVPAKPNKKHVLHLFEKHEYVRGLIQVATVIWIVFRNELPEVETYITNLYQLASTAIPMFLKYYKGTPVYYATVSFASVIPIAKLRPVSTISSACISELKEITERTDPSKIECLIYSLCAWNRGYDVLDLASDWLNFAFREQNLNNTALAKTSNQKVRFLQNTGKPMLALTLLDILFSDVINERRILDKNYEQLHEFYTCLERILVIIERKLAGDERFNNPETTLTDEFIARAFDRYVCLMHTLHRPKKSSSDTDEIPPFDAAAVLMKSMSWATEVLCPKIPLQEGNNPPPLAVRCCLTVMEQCSLAVMLGETNEEHCQALCLFTKDLLSLECSWFLSASFNVILAVGEHAEAFTPNDEWHLLKQVLPCLFEKGLSVIINSDATPQSIKTVVKDLPKFKNALFSLPKIYYQTYGEQSVEFKEVYKNLIQTCVLLVLQEINYEETAVTHSKLEDLPCFATIILKVVIFKSFLMRHLIPTLVKFMENFSKNQDGMSLLSCVSILYTVIVAAKRRFTPAQLEDALSRSYQIVSMFQPKERPPQDDTFSDASVQIDIYKVAIPIIVELGNYLGCAVFKPLAASSPTGSLQALNAPDGEGNAQSVSFERVLELEEERAPSRSVSPLTQELSVSNQQPQASPSPSLQSERPQDKSPFQEVPASQQNSPQESPPSQNVSRKTSRKNKKSTTKTPKSSESSLDSGKISEKSPKPQNSKKRSQSRESLISQDSSPSTHNTSKSTTKSEMSPNETSSQDLSQSLAQLEESPSLKSSPSDSTESKSKKSNRAKKSKKKKIKV